MRFGIHTLDEFDVQGKTVLCRVDIESAGGPGDGCPQEHPARSPPALLR